MKFSAGANSEQPVQQPGRGANFSRLLGVIFVRIEDTEGLRNQINAFRTGEPPREISSLPIAYFVAR